MSSETSCSAPNLRGVGFATACDIPYRFPEPNTFCMGGSPQKVGARVDAPGSGCGSAAREERLELLLGRVQVVVERCLEAREQVRLVLRPPGVDLRLDIRDDCALVARERGRHRGCLSGWRRSLRNVGSRVGQHGEPQQLGTMTKGTIA